MKYRRKRVLDGRALGLHSGVPEFESDRKLDFLSVVQLLVHA